MKKEKTVFLAIRIPEKMRDRLKMHALKNKTSIQVFVKNLIEKSLEEKKHDK